MGLIGAIQSSVGEASESGPVRAGYSRVFKGRPGGACPLHSFFPREANISNALSRNSLSPYWSPLHRHRLCRPSHCGRVLLCLQCWVCCLHVELWSGCRHFWANWLVGMAHKRSCCLLSRTGSMHGCLHSSDCCTNPLNPNRFPVLACLSFLLLTRISPASILETTSICLEKTMYASQSLCDSPMFTLGILSNRLPLLSVQAIFHP